MASSAHVHRFRDDRLKKYLEKPRKGYRTLPFSIREKLLIAHKDLLFPCNAEARIDFAHIVAQAMQDFGIAQLEPHHFVTYTPADGVLPLGNASAFDISKLKQRLRQAMPEIPFIGMIEAALYKEWGPNGPWRGADFVSWHAHLITWRVQREALQAALADLSERVRNMYDRSSIHIQATAPGQIEKALVD